MTGPGAHQHSAAELAQLLEAERAGTPHLVLRDGTGTLVLVMLDGTRTRLAIGRVLGSDLMIDWDTGVSRLHAELERVGGAWVLVDDGLSSNGTFVNGQRLQGRSRLEDGDTIAIGATTIRFRDPEAPAQATTPAAGRVAIVISPAQRRVLLELCRPIATGASVLTPATNQAIADALFLSTESVKSHMKALFERFGVEDLPHNRKRARLVDLAFEHGVVTRAELRDG